MEAYKLKNPFKSSLPSGDELEKMTETIMPILRKKYMNIVLEEDKSMIYSDDGQTIKFKVWRKADTGD